MRSSALVMTVLASLVVTGCARPPAADQSATASPTDTVRSSSDAISDELGHVVQTYGDAHPDEFAGVYYDGHGDHVVARFTGHLDLHQHALDALVGSSGRVTVQAAVFTEATLQKIVESMGDRHQQLAQQGIALMSAAVDVIHNYVEIQVKSDDPDAARVVRAFGPDGAIEVVALPADKPWTQPTEGPGWRLLGVFETDLPYTVALAADRPALGREWGRYKLPGDPPAWDPARELVIFLSDAHGSSCPDLRLDGVVTDATARLVYGEISVPNSPQVCTMDLAGARTFVVAVARDRLPPSPFTLRLHEEPMPCEPDCYDGPSSIQVDLR